MLGFPTETREDMMATLDLMKEIQPDYCTVSIFTPYPGTQIFSDLLEEGKVSPEMNWSRFSHGSPHNYFAKYLSKEEFAELIDYATAEFDRYNGNFSRLLKRAHSKGSIYIHHPGDFFKDIYRYFQWRRMNQSAVGSRQSRKVNDGNPANHAVPPAPIPFPTGGPDLGAGRIQEDRRDKKRIERRIFF